MPPMTFWEAYHRSNQKALSPRTTTAKKADEGVRITITKNIVNACLEEFAQRAYPDLTLPRAVDWYLGTPAGAKFYAQYVAAPDDER